MGTKSENIDKVKGKSNRKKFMKVIFHHNKISFFITTIALIINSLLDIYLASLLQRLLDIAIGGTFSRLIELLKESVILFIVYMTVVLVIRKFRNQFIRIAMKQYKEHAFSKIINKSISSFTQETTGRYISVLTNDIVVIEQKLLQGLFTILVRLFWLIGALTLMFWYSWKMTFAVIGLCFIPVGISLFFGTKLASEEKELSNKNEGFISLVKDLLSGYTVIKSFKAETEVSKLFYNNNEKLEKNKYQRRMTEEKIGVISMAASFIVQIGVFGYGAYLAIGGSITAGVVIAFIQLINYILVPVRELPSLFANYKAAVVLIDKFGKIVDLNVQRDGKCLDYILKKGILLENVSFGYSDEKEVLKKINISFEVGKSYAIVGGSGSGKSTLLNLLLGSYDNYQGKILFDNEELRQINLDSLYDILSIIQQNVFVFDSTIKDNITLFKAFNEDRVNDAIQRAGLNELINEKGIEYSCGENGVGLSGGEKQRISIARCLLKNTPVLLMDEATAALDASTAISVSEAILDIQDLTRIIVTHKLEEKILKRYDEIIVLHNGEICEHGKFEDLIAANGYFYSLNVVSKQ